MDKLDQKNEARAPDTPRATVDIRDFVIYLLLVISTLAAYSQVRSYDFVAYDDPEYVTANPIVRSGLTLHGLTWAFTTDRDGKLVSAHMAVSHGGFAVLRAAQWTASHDKRAAPHAQRFAFVRPSQEDDRFALA